MTKIATVPTPPKVDLDAVVGLHKANLETVLQAHRIVSETAQAVVTLHAGWLQEAAEQVRGAFAKAGATRKPEAVLADARAVVERAFAVARQEIDLGTRAQSEVVDLLAKRAAANLDQVKAFAAAA